MPSSPPPDSFATMTSLAVLPLKRSITDIMDDDPYQLPMSPITSQPNQNGLRSDSPKPHSLFRNVATSVASSPALTHSTLQNQSNSNNLSNLLNIPDGFMEHYNRLNGSNHNLVNTNITIDTETQSNDYSNAANNMFNRINPFTDYGNPDSTNFVQPQQIHPTVRRRRITTLEDIDSGSKSSKNKSNDDNYLFNTDIQPSQLIDEYLYNDSSLFVPPPPSIPPSNNPNNNDGFDLANFPIPGYENDYLLIDELDEEVEEDLSDDDDDDNYFHDDNDFDDYIMNSNSNNGFDNFFMDYSNNSNTLNANDNTNDDETSTNSNFISLENVNGGFIDDFGINRPINKFGDDELLENDAEPNNIVDEDDDAMMIDPEEDEVELPSPSSTQLTTPLHDHHDDEDYFPKKSSPKNIHHFKTAAEISAHNPNHQCDLINPSTGHPCNKQFSRPYDLIRHQETIHATKKKIFRCVICEGRLNGGPGNGKQKTFSRGDALSRHIKVKHGLGGKDALDLINDAKENVEYVSV